MILTLRPEGGVWLTVERGVKRAAGAAPGPLDIEDDVPRKSFVSPLRVKDPRQRLARRRSGAGYSPETG